jgi:hypothetical protein
MDGDRPLCAASPWYIAQSGAVPAVPLADDGDDGDACADDGTLVDGAVGAADVDGTEDDTELAVPEQPARASARIAASALPRRRRATPQS